MHDTVKVAVLGTGQMGSGIIRALLEKKGLALVGAYARRPARAGLDAGLAVGSSAIGVRVSNDLPGMLDGAKPHVVIQATCSRVADAEGEIRAAIGRGAHVISIAEEMAYPAHRAPDTAAALHALAVDRGVTVLGTGINPGFVLDLLVVALTGVCRRVDAITARRVNDLSPYGPSVLAAQGVGLTPEAFERGVRTGAVAGHLGFPESICLIAKALGWSIDRIEQSRQPIVSAVARETPCVRVEPGQTAGCLHTATAYRGGAAAIRLIHPQQIHPALENVETGDSIDIEGDPAIHMAVRPEISGGAGTIALAINMIPLVVDAPAGLKTVLDLPVPRALAEDP